ncbi:hypothetical protein HNQ08_002974 [Deinococcus humi]|uniref:Uncharacterized protein n=1 Tax=Deinococcus humi TaxID=662880 RepID=A0A7W8JVA6_9DEIO|nr:hypothetical protein [Deinococcus humi]GGO31685.1 hypothetical protein GCM10008949_28060 [Deinococcus humi]
MTNGRSWEFRTPHSLSLLREAAEQGEEFSLQPLTELSRSAVGSFPVVHELAQQGPGVS